MRILPLFLMNCVLFISLSCSKNDPEPPQEVTFTCDKCDYIVEGYANDGSPSELNFQPGQIICLKGMYNKLRFMNVKGTAANPIIIRNCDETAIISSPEGFGVKFEKSEHFKFLGDGTGSKNYGIKISTKSGFFLTMEMLSTNFEIAQVEIAGLKANGLGEDNGFAGIGVKTSPYQICELFTDPSRQSWIMRDISIHNNYIHDTGGEGLYIGHGFYKGRKESECTSITYSHSIKGIRIYDNRIENTGYDGIQLKNADEDCEVYNNVIKNYGNRNEGAHNEGLFIGEGVTGKIYNNLVFGGTGNGIQFQGMGNNDIFNNIVINAGEHGFFGAHGDYVVRIPDGYFNIFNNTIYNSAEIGFVFYNNDGGEKRFINNIIAKAAQLNPNGASLINSNNILTNDISAIKFVDPNSGNLKLNSGSSAINNGFDVRTYFGGLTFDFERKQRPRGAAFDIGAIEQE